MRARIAFACLLALAPAARGARTVAHAEDAAPPPAAPPAPAPTPKPAPRPKAPEVPGIVWERDLEAGLRRSVAEGRPTYFCVNALLDEGERGNLALFTDYYRAREVGEATRGWVCFVCNGNRHAETTLPDATKVCSKYGSGTCDAHQAALAHVLRKYSTDGTNLVSPSHYVVDPDGALVYHADFMQGRLDVKALDAYFVTLSPRLALRAVWAARDARMDALAKAAPTELAAVGREWIASGDPYAPAGLVAALDTESDAARRAALLQALASTPAAGQAVLQDAVESATSQPDADAVLALGWVETALAVDPDLGAWAAARVIARAKDAGLVEKASTAWIGTGGPGAARPAPAIRARLSEALALRGEASGAAALPADAEAAGWAPARVARAMRRAGKGEPVALGEAPRDVRRDALLAASPEQTKQAKEVVLGALKDPVEEVRVAAALALRRAGDPAGAEVLRRALADPVEGPEVRAALVAYLGDDRGADPGAWDDVLHAAEGGAK